MKKLLAGGLIITLLLIFTATHPIIYKLCIRNTDGKILASLDIQKNDHFEITFRHSVNKGLVKERFSICEGESIALTTAWFENYGAGMLDTIPEGAKISEEGSFLRIDFVPNKQASVSYAAAGIAGHELTIISSDQKIKLFDINPYGTCNISVVKLSILQNFINYFSER